MATFDQATGKTGLQEFITSMNRSKGFARLSRYAVVITPPSNLNRLITQAQTETGAPGEITDEQERNMDQLKAMSANLGQQLSLHCNSISMPGHDLQAQDMQHGSAPGRQIVQSHDYAGTIAASFYLDSHLRERHLFEMWQKMAVNTSTHKANYYDDYIGSLEIFQLDGNNQITYGIKATEVYPTTIGGIEYSYGNENQIAKQSVGFAYRQWWNLTADTIADYQGANIFDFNTDKIGKLLLGKVFGL